MLFKNPEILYFLFLLIIPILVHLFQLQRFVKVPFTNVAFLKKISIESRKSSRLKKWIILSMRLFALASLIFAFAQPYLAQVDIDKQHEISLYLDNSLSMGAKGEKGVLLKLASNSIIENVSDDISYNLITNDDYYKELKADELKSIVRKIKISNRRVNMEDIMLRISTNTKSNVINNNIMISDFQNATASTFYDKDVTLVNMGGILDSNLSIDSVYFEAKTNKNFNVFVRVVNKGKKLSNVPLGIYNSDRLISKQNFDILANGSKVMSFPVQEIYPFLGKVKLLRNDAFSFDNTFYFSVNSQDKIKVLAIGDYNSFLKKIYTNDDYDFISTKLEKLDYTKIDSQQLILLNELKEIPVILLEAIKRYTNKGGDVVVIPSVDSNLNSYNRLFNSLRAGKVEQMVKDSLKVTKIHFDNPLLKGVFNKRIKNFQYPSVQSYSVSKFNKQSSIVSFENEKAFISHVKLKRSNLYWVASGLNKVNSNFINSPLVVPVFYNIGKQSLQNPKLYYTIGASNKIDVSTKVVKDGVVEFKGVESFIPLQQSYQNKITLSLQDKPVKSGFYYAVKGRDTLKSIAFNNPKSESKLNFLSFKENDDRLKTSTSIKQTLQDVNNTTKVNWLWKWFLILVVVFLLLEIFFLKFFRI